MQTRQLFLVGYDIGCPSRLKRALKLVRGHALGGQKSFYECWLGQGELQAAMQAMRDLVCEQDRVVFIQLDARCKPMLAGEAQPIHRGDYFLIQ